MILWPAKHWHFQSSEVFVVCLNDARQHLIDLFCCGMGWFLRRIIITQHLHIMKQFKIINKGKCIGFKKNYCRGSLLTILAVLQTSTPMQQSVESLIWHPLNTEGLPFSLYTCIYQLYPKLILYFFYIISTLLVLGSINWKSGLSLDIFSRNVLEESCVVLKTSST